MTFADMHDWIESDQALRSRLDAFGLAAKELLSIDDATFYAKKPPFEIAQFVRHPDPRRYLAHKHWGDDVTVYPTSLDEEEIGRDEKLTWTIPCVPHEEVRKLWRDIVNPPGETKELPFPGFYVAAPRKGLNIDMFDGTHRLKIGILTAGGIAPGLNTVVHRILRRHEIYTLNALKKSEAKDKDKKKGATLLQMTGYHDGFNGLCSGEGGTYKFLISSRIQGRLNAIHHDLHNNLAETDMHKNLGGSFLGAGRMDVESETWLDEAAGIIEDHNLDILYCIGGNGTVTGAHMLAKRLESLGKKTRICVVPKTIDNDILWVENSFGFQSSVDKGVSALEEMYTEARGTNRVAIVQFMGRDSGFIAANASLASGITTLCLVPEVHKLIDIDEIYKRYKDELESSRGHGLIAIAEGCRASAWRGLPKDKAKQYESIAKSKKEADERLPAGQLLFEALNARIGSKRKLVFHDAGYVVRSVAPNPTDRILCRRLANLAVDNILAGYDRFVVAPALGGYALVPLEMAADSEHGGRGGPKTINPKGRFWAEVASRNDQIEFDRDLLELAKAEAGLSGS